MSISLGEKAVINVLQTAWGTFTQNASFFVPDIYGYETQANQDAILAWLQTNPKVLIDESFLQQPVQDPQIVVRMASDQEVAERQFIGRSRYVSAAGQYSASTSVGSTYEIGVHGPNQNLILWLQMWVKWALWYNTLTLEQQYGLYKQRVSGGPLEPDPNSMQDSVFPFYRRLWLEAEHNDTWTMLAGTQVTSASVTLEVSND